MFCDYVFIRSIDTGSVDRNMNEDFLWWLGHIHVLPRPWSRCFQYWNVWVRLKLRVVEIVDINISKDSSADFFILYLSYFYMTRLEFLFGLFSAKLVSENQTKQIASNQ